LEEVGLEENFFALGGHSLLAGQVLARIRSVFGVDLPLRLIFENATVREMARQIESSRWGTRQVPLQHVGRGNMAPLSYSQQRLWFLDRLEPHNVAYNIPFRVRLRGGLNKTALRRAVTELTNRHETLRTRFVERDGVGWQEIGPEGPAVIEELDIQSSNKKSEQRKLDELAKREMAAPFDLSVRPLLRLKLAQLSSDEHVLVGAVHHMISDGWSTAIFLRELAVLYQAICKGTPAVLPALPIQYADYSIWQKTYLVGEALELHEAYWKRQLADLSPLELPADYARKDDLKNSAENLFFSISPQLSLRVHELSRREGVTMFMLLMAAFQVLLGWYTKRDDIAVGTDVANRNHVETEGLIGFFTNQLVLRVALGGSPAFSEFLQRVRKATLDAYAHQEMPFDRLVEILAPERRSNRNPLVEVKFVYQNVPQYKAEIEGLEIIEEPPLPSTAKFDLLLTLMPEAGALKGDLQYRKELFRQSTMEMLLRRLEQILDVATKNPDIRLDTLMDRMDTFDQQLLKHTASRTLQQTKRRRIPV